jgi:hypothetical protein
VPAAFPDEASREYYLALQPDGYGPSGPYDEPLLTDQVAALPRDHDGLTEFLKTEYGGSAVTKAVVMVYGRTSCRRAHVRRYWR